MSDEGEKTCPLCAEEMDLTDQQLKPCKCGYEICVWCWHHIMDMAEKDELEGCCPACRTPYNKEKIVGTTASCERLVSEMNGEKKPKSSRGKNKSLEGRKQLASVRVIQRNLVYAVGLPLNMADDDLLQHKEYFGQYGKVLKVSISRTASGAIQHFANNTCSVYITYSKEEEAVSCIQSVHGFFLDGKPLRACFGTTKYCHAWLKNVTCSNPDCLYLHEIGSQEDSFTKDEIISAYTRVQQIAGSTNSAQRRSGYMLPPPADEYHNNTFTSSGKPINKTAVNTNNTQITVRVSPPNSSSGRSVALPAGASWGTRVANNLPVDSSIQCSNGMLGKPDVSDELMACSTTAVSQMQLSSSVHSESAKISVTGKDIIVSHDKTDKEALRPVVKESKTDAKATLSQSKNTSARTTTLPLNKQPLCPSITKLPDFSTNDVNSSLVSGGFASGRDSSDATNGKMEKMTHSHFMPTTSIQILDGYVQIAGGTVTSQTSETTANTNKELDSRGSQLDFGLGMPRSRTPSPATEFGLSDIEDDLLSFENQRLKDPEVAPYRNKSSHTSRLSCHSNINSTRRKADASISLDRQVVDKIGNFPNGHSESILKAPKVPELNGAEYSNFFSYDTRTPVGRFDGELNTAAFNIDENTMISKILSIDPWDESLYSPQNLAKLLCINYKQQGVLSSWKSCTRSQSRFAFAREEEPSSQASGFGQSVDEFTIGSYQGSLGNDNSFRLEKQDTCNGFPFLNGMESEIFSGNHAHMSSNRIFVSRPQFAAPPGFAVHNKTPAPDCTSHDRTNRIFDGSGNYQLGANPMLRHNNYEIPSVGNAIINGDIDLIDPAILAVGKGLLPRSVNNSGLDDLRTHYASQLNAYEEAKFQSILQRPLPSHQSKRFSGVGGSFSLLGDAYSISSRVMEQTLANNISPLSHFTLPQSMNGLISNRQWDGWNELQDGNNLGRSEILRHEGLGFNKLYGGYEDSKISMPNSGNLFMKLVGFEKEDLI